MAKIEMQGMEAYLKQLENVAWASKDVCRAAVYAGADVVADAIRRAVDGLQTVSDADALAAYHDRKPVKISVTQKNGLREALGVAGIRDKYGIISTKIGFDGYNNVKTRRWPQGQPNQLIARACESGSTAMVKQPYIRPAVKSVQGAAVVEMERAADKKLKEILGGNANG